MKKLNQTTLNAIRTADQETLSAIIKEIKARQRSMQQEIATSFTIGDKVTFDARRRGIVEGLITKVNQKTVKVKQTNGLQTTWSVSPSLLKKVG
jgi:hypothetical protein